MNPILNGMSVPHDHCFADTIWAGGDLLMRLPGINGSSDCKRPNAL